MTETGRDKRGRDVKEASLGEVGERAVKVRHGKMKEGKKKSYQLNSCQQLLQYMYTYTTTTIFPGTIRVSRCPQKKASSGLYGASVDNRRQTHRQSGWTPLHLDQSAIYFHQSTPHFTPGAVPATTLLIYPGLGQVQEYAGLHTSWLGLYTLKLSIKANNSVWEVA